MNFLLFGGANVLDLGPNQESKGSLLGPIFLMTGQTGWPIYPGEQQNQWSQTLTVLPGIKGRE